MSVVVSSLAHLPPRNLRHLQMGFVLFLHLQKQKGFAPEHVRLSNWPLQLTEQEDSEGLSETSSGGGGACKLWVYICVSQTNMEQQERSSIGYTQLKSTCTCMYIGTCTYMYNATLMLRTHLRCKMIVNWSECTCTQQWASYDDWLWKQAPKWAHCDSK